MPVLFFLASCSETNTSKDDVIKDPLPNDAAAVYEFVSSDELCDPASSTSVFAPATAIVATTAADFGSGAHAIISGDANGQFTSLNNLDPGFSDITVATYGDHLYRIGRQGAGNSITKYAIDDPQTVIWQYSVDDPGNAVSSNPHDIIFVSETKAYVLRYNKTSAWIVNPSASSEAGFKLGELDLSAYGAADGIPEMDAGFVADGRLYIFLQRLDGVTQQVVDDAYIAVFDVSTDREVDVAIAGDELKGIPLSVRNPTAFSYQPASNTLFVQASGSFFPVKYVGGIEMVSLSDYSRSLVLDDGDDADHPYGLITSLAVLTENRFYFIGYQSYTDNTLYVVDIASKKIAQLKVAQLVAGQIEDISIDRQGLLWVSDNANATVRIVDPLSCEEIDAVSTNLNPAKIVFAQ